MSGFIGDWHALWLLLIAGILPNGVWRMLGVWVGGGIDEESEVLIWVRAVATAILAGVITQILAAPPGALASVPIEFRFAATIAGFAAYLGFRKSVLAGVLVGEIVIMTGKYLYG